MIDASAFDFDTMKRDIGDPFAQENNKYPEDTRFYKLTKDKNGNGAALVRFLPDSERAMIQKLFKINTTIFANEAKRFVSEFSPSTIGQPCPFQEKWQHLWNLGEKEKAKQFSRGIKYVANIKILKDPQNPANEGKIFLYEMSGAMKDKIQGALDPSEQDRALGAVPKQLFNPLLGNSFRLVAKRGANGQINYDSSEVINEITAIYKTIEEALEDIKQNTHKLSSLVQPESFMSYEELQKKLKWVTFADVAEKPSESLTAEVSESKPKQPEVVPVETKQVAEQPKAKPQDDLNDLLNSLVIDK